LLGSPLTRITIQRVHIAPRTGESDEIMKSNEYPNPLGFGDSGLALDLTVGIR
jgi:hypothetical protein